MTTATLELATRLCKLGSNINGRTEKHGDQDVPACDFPLVGLMLEPAELCALLGDDKAHESLFRRNESGTFEPIFAKHFKPLKLLDRFKAATVGLWFAGANDFEADIELADVTLANLELEPQVGGLTALEVQVQARPTFVQMAELFEQMNSQIHALVSFGKRAEKASKKQQALPLGNDVETDKLSTCQYATDEQPCGANATCVIGGVGICDEHAQAFAAAFDVNEAKRLELATELEKADGETPDEYAARRQAIEAEAARRGDDPMPQLAPGEDLPPGVPEIRS